VNRCQADGRCGLPEQVWTPKQVWSLGAELVSVLLGYAVRLANSILFSCIGVAQLRGT